MGGIPPPSNKATLDSFEHIFPTNLDFPFQKIQLKRQGKLGGGWWCAVQIQFHMGTLQENRKFPSMTTWCQVKSQFPELRRISSTFIQKEEISCDIPK